MECMSFGSLNMGVSLILIYVIQKLVGLAEQASPMVHLILAFGMVIMILVSILTAYMEAMLYLRSQQSTTLAQQSNNSQTVTQGNHHNHGGSNREYGRSNCSNHSNDACNKDRSNGSGHGAVAAISATVSSQQRSTTSQPYNALANGSGKSSNNSININKNNNNNNTSNSSSNNGKSSNNCTQKRRKNSSTANGEKVATSNKSLGSTTNDKKSSSPYAPIFQNLTNVIASPPPPLPTFDTEFNSLEFKKFRNHSHGSSSKDCGRSNCSNHSNDACTKDRNNGTSGQGAAAPISATVSSQQRSPASPPFNALANGSGKGSNNSINISKNNNNNNTSNSSSNNGKSSNSCTQKRRKNSSTANGEKVPTSNKSLGPATVMPIQPPSSLSSTPSSSSSSSSTASTSSSTSSSPPLSASSYGEYSLLGPGATFELPCLRVRSAQI